MIRGFPFGIPMLKESISIPIVLAQEGFLCVTLVPFLVILELKILLPSVTFVPVFVVKETVSGRVTSPSPPKMKNSAPTLPLLGVLKPLKVLLRVLPTNVDTNPSYKEMFLSVALGSLYTIIIIHAPKLLLPISACISATHIVS